jgi:fungal STAND N-terminal Goodbye domain
MPQTPAESPARANYQAIFDSALQEYTKKTRKDLSSNPLFNKLQSCDSPDDIITILRQQIPKFDQSASGSNDDRLTRWLDPTVKVINAFSATISGAVALVGPTVYEGTRPESAR